MSMREVMLGWRADGTEDCGATSRPESGRFGIVKQAVVSFDLVSRGGNVGLEVVLCTEDCFWGSWLPDYPCTCGSIYR